MVEEVIIINEKNLEETKGIISKDGADKFHVLADFDRTLTYGACEDGKTKTATVISQLRSDPKYLGQEYADEAHRLHGIYYPIEIDPHISLEEKKEKMHEWWKVHFDWIAKNGLTKEIIKQVVRERPLRFRKGALEFMKELHEKNIPLVIMSAAPGDMLLGYLEQSGLFFPNIYVVANRFEFDSEGRALQIIEPIIHTFNKTEVTLNGHEVYDHIRNRKNILLLGDSLGDEGMAQGFDYKNLIKIGFYNSEKEGDIKDYEKAFDVILTGDQDFTYVNELLQEMLGK